MPNDEDNVRMPPALMTPTLAELYLRQGHTARALAVYRGLLERQPGDAALEERVAILEARLRTEQSQELTLARVERLKKLLRRVQRARRGGGQ